MSLEYKLDDFDILNEDVPTVNIVGRSFFGLPKIIDSITVDELSIGKFYIFVREWPQLMERHIALLQGLEINLTDLDDETKLENLRIKIQQLFSYVAFRKSYIRFIKKIGLTKLSKKKFEKYSKPSQLATIFVYLYRQNVDGLKKKLMCLLKKCYSTRIPMSEIFTTSSSEGVGSKTKTLPVRYPRLSNAN